MWIKLDFNPDMLPNCYTWIILWVTSTTSKDAGHSFSLSWYTNTSSYMSYIRSAPDGIIIDSAELFCGNERANL